MVAIFCALKMYHTIEAGKGGADTTHSMGIKLLLGQDIATVLVMLVYFEFKTPKYTRNELTHLTRKRYHDETSLY